MTPIAVPITEPSRSHPTLAYCAAVVRVLLLASLGLMPPLSNAQQPGQTDPLMSLLMSQPRMELEAPVFASAVFDPPYVRPGEETVYRITMNALEESVEFPDPFPSIAGMTLRPGARGHMLQMSGTNMEPRGSFLFHLKPTAEGRYVMPSFTAQAYGKPVTVPAAELIVTERPPPGTPVAHRLRIDVPKTNYYIGEPVRPRVMLPFPYGHIQTLSQVAVQGQGFIVDMSGSRQRIEPIPMYGTNMIVYIYEPLMTPIAAGKQSFYVQGWSVVNKATGPVYVTNGMVMNLRVEHTFVDSNPFELNIRPLPARGNIEGFTGAVGVFTNDPPKLSTNAARVGDPLKLSVTIRGDGNLARLVPPPAPQSSEWQVFEASGDPSPAQVINAQGAVTFSYTMIPLAHGVLTTPPVLFSYFDPRREQYVTLRVQPLRAMVAPGPHGAAPEVFAQADAGPTNAPDVPRLGPLSASAGPGMASLQPLQRRPWFVVVQATPAIAFFALWQWDRRRRFLQRHPDIVLRRKARRALRGHLKALREAAQHRDTPAFARHAVDALRAAIAPHYPAEERALVGRDVIRMLPEGEHSREAGVVRRVFELTDSQVYSQEHALSEEILRLQPDLENILAELDSQLAAGITAAPLEQAPDYTKAFSIAGSLLLLCNTALAISPEELFKKGVNAYESRQFNDAAGAFRAAANLELRSGILHNLGNAEWQAGRVGEAVLAWEQALWVDPYNTLSRSNLAYARLTAQLESPQLAWYEVVSSWLPINAWPWITGATLWLAVGLVLLPGLFGQQKESWHQGLAAFALTVLLLSLPAHAGIHTRSKLAFALEQNTPLRLTPTAEGQTVTRLAPGEPVRRSRTHGSFVLVRTSRFSGWVDQHQIGPVCP